MQPVEHFFRAARQWPNEIAVLAPDRRVTFAELAAEVVGAVADPAAPVGVVCDPSTPPKPPSLLASCLAMAPTFSLLMISTGSVRR